MFMLVYSYYATLNNPQQSKEVGFSHHVEKKALRRSLDLLKSNDLAVDYIVTDRHPRIQHVMKERNITHFYDVWHFEKGKDFIPVYLLELIVIITTCPEAMS